MEILLGTISVVLCLYAFIEGSYPTWSNRHTIAILLSIFLIVISAMINDWSYDKAEFVHTKTEIISEYSNRMETIKIILPNELECKIYKKHFEFSARSALYEYRCEMRR